MKLLWIASLLLAVTASVLGQAQSPAVPGPNEAAARLLVREAKASAIRVKNTFQRGLLLDEIGAMQARLREYDSAVSTAETAYPHTLKTLAALGTQLADDPASLNRVCPMLKSGEASTVIANAAWAQADKGDVELALRTSKSVPDPAVRSDVLRELATRQSAAGDVAGARKSLSEANDAYPATKSSPEGDIELIANGQLSRGNRVAARKTIEGIGSREMQAAALISGAELLDKAGDRGGARAWLLDAFELAPRDLPG